MNAAAKRAYDRLVNLRRSEPEQRAEPLPPPRQPDPKRLFFERSSFETARPASYARVLGTAASASSLPPQVRAALDQELARHPEGSEAREVLTALGDSPGLAAMRAEDAVRLVRVVGGTNDIVSVPARAGLKGLLESDGFKGGGPEGQRAALDGFLRGFYPPNGVPTPDGAFDHQRLEATVTGPETVPNHPFASGASDALRYQVTVGGRTVPVFMPKDGPVEPLEQYSIEEVARSLGAMPPALFARVQHVSVEPNRNPSDSYWAEQYGDPSFRSYLTAGADGIVSIYPQPRRPETKYLDSGFVHEVGHVLSMSAWGSSGTEPGWARWRRAMESETPLYKDSTRFILEDFAEAMKLYQLVRGTPQEAELRGIMPGRFALIDELLGGRGA